MRINPIHSDLEYLVCDDGIVAEDKCVVVTAQARRTLATYFLHVNIPSGASAKTVRRLHCNTHTYPSLCPSIFHLMSDNKCHQVLQNQPGISSHNLAASETAAGDACADSLSNAITREFCVIDT